MMGLTAEGDLHLDGESAERTGRRFHNSGQASNLKDDKLQ